VEIGMAFSEVDPAIRPQILDVLQRADGLQIERVPSIRCVNPRYHQSVFAAEKDVVAGHVGQMGGNIQRVRGIRIGFKTLQRTGDIFLSKFHGFSFGLAGKFDRPVPQRCCAMS